MKKVQTIEKTPLYIWLIVIVQFCIIPFAFHPYAVDTVTPIRIMVLTGAIILGYLILLMIKKESDIP